MGSTPEASSTLSSRHAVSPGLGASKNGSGNVTGSTAIPSARVGEMETNAAADPRISPATSLLELIISLVLSLDNAATVSPEFT